MINILFFIESLSGGGAEKVLCNLVNAMDQTQFAITVQTLYPEDAGKYLAQGIRYRYCYPKASRWNDRRMRIEAALGLTYPLHIRDAYSAALYLLFVKRLSTVRFSAQTINCLAFLTEMSFGVYCIHALINELFPFCGSLPVLRTLSIYLISLVLTWLIRKIPVVGKKIT